MSKSLSDIRVEIDEIDNKVHDLFMRRASLVSSVAAVKKAAGLQIVHPAREAKLMRRLLSRHEGVLPRSTIVRIWRELISSVSLLQAGLSVVVSSNKYWDMSKDYFGSEIPMQDVLSTQNAIIEVQENGAYFAVMPWAVLDEKNQWWEKLFNEKIFIIGALPYGRLGTAKDKALVISKINFMDSGDDISFIGLRLNSEISRDLITERAINAGFDVINIYGSDGSYLLEVKGFVDNLGTLQDSFDDKCRYCSVIGGYPIISNI